MRQFTWEEYYGGFFDWSTSTQIAYSRNLTSYGPPDEVFEVAEEIAYGHEKYASNFILNAMDAGVRFTPEQVIEGSIFLQKDALNKMALCASRTFSREELEDVYQVVDDATFELLSKRACIDIFAEDEEPNSFEDDAFPDDSENNSEESASKAGFFAALFASLGIAKSHGHRHSGKCDGDCAHCPPHYGYRYGRWYYGHGHQYGCEFGGNKGDGSL